MQKSNKNTSYKLALADTAPNYIPAKKIAGTPLNYEWDVEFPFSLIDDGLVKTMDKLKKISNRGLIAYSIACGEWVVYRISNVINDLLPYYYIEAFWAYVIGYQELFEYPYELDHEVWGSYEKGPIDCAISSIMNVIYMSEHYDPPINEAARIAMLAMHVLENEKLFIEWENRVLDRLVKYCPREKDKPEGEPIPREIMDETISGDNLITVDFEGKDFSGNPFYIAGKED